MNNDQDELDSRKLEQTHSIAENVIGIFSKGKTRRLKGAITKGRMKDQAEADVEELRISIEQLNEQITDLQKQKEQKSQEITTRWGEMVEKVEEIALTPKKSNIFVDHFGIGWMPFYQVKSGERTIELPAFGGE